MKSRRSGFMEELAGRYPTGDVHIVWDNLNIHLDGSEQPKPTRPLGRIPRVARLLALAHPSQELLDARVVETQPEITELAKLTRRVPPRS